MVHHTRHRPKTRKKPVQDTAAQPDKKAHTAGLGILLILLTNYQAEVKQIFSFLWKSLT
jgi:hypothetical protein